MHRALRFVLVFAAAATAACGGQEQPDSAATVETSAGKESQRVSEPAASDITPQMVALGNEIFHGREANAICYTCHGMDATGGPGGLGPNLTDTAWLHSEGGFAEIVNTIRTGVPQPVNAPAPMPPFGGATLTNEQLLAVAAYVYSLSHAEVPRPAS